MIAKLHFLRLRNCHVAGAKLALALAILTTSAQANLVQNGGFDQTTQNFSSVIGPRHGQYLTEWTVGETASGAINNYVYQPGTADTTGARWYRADNLRMWGPGQGEDNGLPATSPGGGNFLALDAPMAANSPVSQTINGLVVGQSYELTFYYGAVQAVGPNWEGPSTSWLTASFGGETQETAHLSIPHHGFSGWQSAAFTFTATSGSQVLSFLTDGGPESAPPFVLLDGVSLAPVPEPATLALLGAGLAGIGFARLRRKSAHPPTADRA